MLTASYACRASSSNANLNMANQAYVTSSPAATTGGQGNSPVSAVLGIFVVQSGLFPYFPYQSRWRLGTAPRQILIAASLKSPPILSPIALPLSLPLSALSFISLRCFLAFSLRHYGNRFF